MPEKLGDEWANAGHKRVLLKASSDTNTLETHIALRKMKGVYWVLFGKQHHKTLKIEPLDIFSIQLIEDTTKYGVVTPEAFDAVYDSDPDGASIFESLTDGKKRGLIYQVKRYKSEQTQVDKMLILFENLKRGIRDPRQLFKTG